MIKSVLWLVVAAFVGTIFLVWGRGSDVATPEIVATVEGMPIYSREVQKAYADLFNTYKRLFKDNFDEKAAKRMNLKKIALDSLLTQKLLVLEASKAGLTVSDDELLKKLESMPAFSPNGQFDRNLYLRILKLNRIEPDEFERDLRRSILMDKYAQIIKDGVKVTPAELSDAYTQENEKVTVSYVTIKSSPFRDKVKVTEDELKKYYEQNKNNYIEPDRVKVKYLFIDMSKFKEGTVPGEEEMRKYYEQHKDDFSIRKEKEVRARHILIRAASDAPEAELEKARGKAQNILDQIKKGADFAELAIKNSEDASAKGGGDLGYFKGGDMVKPFEDAAFALKPGQVSELVRSQFGFHIIKVEDVKEPQVEPFEAVKTKISEALTEKKAKGKAKEFAYQVSREVNPNKENLDELAAKYSIGVTTTDYFAKNDMVIGVGMLAIFNNTAFEVASGDISEIIEAPKGYYLMTVLDKKEEHKSSFEEARARMESALKTEKSVAMAKAEADKIEGRLGKGESLADLALSEKLQVEGKGPFKRADNLANLGLAPEAVDLAFSLKQGESGLARAENDFYLIEVVKREAIDTSAFDKEKDDFEKKLIARKKEIFYQEWIQRLKQTSNIKINQDMLAL